MATRVFLVPILVTVLTACGATSRPYEMQSLAATSGSQEIQSLSGLELYERLCSDCHGVEGHGDGPAAPLIKVRVPDLTRVAARDGGEFPTEHVRRIIDGRNDRRAHGPRDMPVWGWQLYDASNADDASERARTEAMIDRLVEYLQSIQRS